MAFPNIFKLEKLTIEAYSDRARTRPATPQAEFVAMFNPASFSQTFETRYATEAAAGSGEQQATFLGSLPTSLSLQLLLDGTGVDQMGLAGLAGGITTVKSRIDDFRNLAYEVQGESHEPNYLIARWGQNLEFRGRLSKLDIAYTSFDRDGMPLRAELAIALLADDDLERQLSQRNRSSPDVTHSRLVVAGDTLPLLAAEVLGSSGLYLKLARANGLDTVRRVAPGRRLKFPRVAP